jgi:hypothetical protein
VLESELRQTGLDVPELYGVVARCTSEDVLGGGVEEDVANLPTAVLDANADWSATWYLMWPLSLATGATSAGSSASVHRVKFSGTFQMPTLPSSEAEEMSESLKGDLRAISAVSLASHAVCDHTSRCRGRQQCGRGREEAGRELGRAR